MYVINFSHSESDFLVGLCHAILAGIFTKYIFFNQIFVCDLCILWYV